MFDPYRISSYNQNYRYSKKGQILQKRNIFNPSRFYPKNRKEMEELLPLFYQYKLLSPLTKEPPPKPPSPPPKPEEEEEEEDKPDPPIPTEYIQKYILDIIIQDAETGHVLIQTGDTFPGLLINPPIEGEGTDYAISKYDKIKNNLNIPKKFISYFKPDESTTNPYKPLFILLYPNGKITLTPSEEIPYFGFWISFPNTLIDIWMQELPENEPWTLVIPMVQILSQLSDIYSEQVRYIMENYENLYICYIQLTAFLPTFVPENYLNHKLNTQFNYKFITSTSTSQPKVTVKEYPGVGEHSPEYYYIQEIEKIEASVITTSKTESYTFGISVTFPYLISLDYNQNILL